MNIGYWKWKQAFTDEDITWQLNLDKLLADVIKGMREHEERATLHIVIEYLRAKGYTVERTNGD